MATTESNRLESYMTIGKGEGMGMSLKEAVELVARVRGKVKREVTTFGPVGKEVTEFWDDVVTFQKEVQARRLRLGMEEPFVQVMVLLVLNRTHHRTLGTGWVDCQKTLIDLRNELKFHVPDEVATEVLVRVSKVVHGV